MADPSTLSGFLQSEDPANWGVSDSTSKPLVDLWASQKPLLKDFLQKAITYAPMAMPAFSGAKLPPMPRLLAPGQLPPEMLAAPPQVAAKTPQFYKALAGEPAEAAMTMPGLKVHGEPIEVFHGTTRQFDRFDKTKSRDFGIHAGNLAQAKDRILSSPIAAYVKGGRVLPMELGTRDRPFTSLEVSDLGTWQPKSMLFELQSRGVNFTPAEVAAINGNKQNSYPIIEQALNRNLVDVLRYRNQGEGPHADPNNIAYITFNPNTLYHKQTGAELYGLPLAGLPATLGGLFGRANEEPPLLE